MANCIHVWQYNFTDLKHKIIMENKKESVKLIIKQEMFGVDGADRGLFNAQSDKVAERIVKLFAIPDVNCIFPSVELIDNKLDELL